MIRHGLRMKRVMIAILAGCNNRGRYVDVRSKKIGTRGWEWACAGGKGARILLKLTWCECRIENVNVNTDVHIVIAHSLGNPIDDPLNSNRVDLPGTDILETTAGVVV